MVEWSAKVVDGLSVEHEVGEMLELKIVASEDGGATGGGWG